MVTLDERTHTYTDAYGAVWPGVTSIIKPLYDFIGIPPAVLNAKAELGRLVHDACDLYDQGFLDHEWMAQDEQDDIRPYVAAYIRFVGACAPAVLAGEELVWNEQLRYAGKLDRIYGMRGREWLVDIKCTAELMPPAWVQLAGYGRTKPGYDKLPRAVLKLNPDATFQFIEQGDRDLSVDWNAFLGCLSIHRWKERNPS